jgi:hypothetical protein
VIVIDPEVEEAVTPADPVTVPELTTVSAPETVVSWTPTPADAVMVPALVTVTLPDPVWTLIPLAVDDVIVAPCATLTLTLVFGAGPVVVAVAELLHVLPSALKVLAWQYGVGTHWFALKL